MSTAIFIIWFEFSFDCVIIFDLIISVCIGHSLVLNEQDDDKDDFASAIVCIGLYFIYTLVWVSEMPLFLLKKEFLFFLTKSENFLFFFKIFNIF